MEEETRHEAHERKSEHSDWLPIVLGIGFLGFLAFLAFMVITRPPMATVQQAQPLYVAVPPSLKL